MVDREKVLTWLEICGKNNDCSGCCPYSENGFGEYGQCRESLMADAYDLLKEQEPMQVKTDMYGNAYCPWCSTDRSIEMEAQKLRLGTKFCPYCGKPVSWE